MFSDDKRVVSLRGKSKKEDRSAVIARAAREREERQRTRERQRAALALQSTYRAVQALRAVRASLRAQFDADMESHMDAETFAARASSLIRALLLFHRHAEPSDALRRRWLLDSLMSSAASEEARTNACACAVVADAPRWWHQMRRLAELCLPHLLLERGAPEGAPSAELRALGYLLDSSRWQWSAMVPSERAAALPAVGAWIARALGARGLHVHVAAALGRSLPPACSSASACSSAAEASHSARR